MKLPIGNYRKIAGYNKNLCAYCGVTAADRPLQNDHYPPVTRKYEFPEHRPVYVRACRKCNITLGNSMQNTLEERKLVACGADWRLFEITGVTDNQL